MDQHVDSYRFLSGLTKRLLQTWVTLEPARPIPWTPLPRPLAACTVALLSSAGLALKTDQPFDQEGERRDPWWGDPTHRVIPVEATEREVAMYHLHVDPAPVAQDLNCLFPLQRLRELAAEGVIGRAAPHHYAIMGYLLQPEALLTQTLPAILARLRAEAVDLVVLAPA